MASTGLPRGPYQNGVRRRQEIIESAAKIFGRFGYSGSSLRLIAEDVGVSPAALLRHFDTKEGLLMAVIEYWDIETDRQFKTEMKGLTWFKMQTQTLARHALDPGLTELFLTLTAEASNPRHPARARLIERYERVVQAGMSQLRIAYELGEIGTFDDAELERDVRAIFAMMDGIQLQWLLNRSLDMVGIFKPYHEGVLKKWTEGSPASRE